jgi:hypothetical protein
MAATFYVWADLASDRVANNLVAALVRRGLQVRSLSGSGRLTWASKVSCLAALQIEIAALPNPLPKDCHGPSDWLRDAVLRALDAKDIVYSVVVVECSAVVGCYWNGAVNLPMPDVEKVPEPEKVTVLDKVGDALDKG